MSGFQLLQSSDAEPPLPARFECYLFNEPRHLRGQSAAGATTFFVVNSETSTTEARLSLFVRDSEALSPLRATFGGIEAATDVPDEALDALLDGVEKWAISQKLSAIRLTQWPFAYAPELAIRIGHRLKAGGYHLIFTEKNQHLDLTRELPLHDSARRRFGKAEGAGFVFQLWENPDWETTHAFVQAARTRKGLPLSLTALELRRLGENFPEELFVFTVRDGTTLAALGVVIRLNARILYHFLPADAGEYLSFSPTIFLNLNLADWARQRGYGLLDLGISTHHGVPNEGLLRFKANLGAEVSGKTSFIKPLEGRPAELVSASSPRPTSDLIPGK